MAMLGEFILGRDLLGAFASGAPGVFTDTADATLTFTLDAHQDEQDASATTTVTATLLAEGTIFNSFATASVSLSPTLSAGAPKVYNATATETPDIFLNALARIGEFADATADFTLSADLFADSFPDTTLEGEDALDPQTSADARKIMLGVASVPVVQYTEFIDPVTFTVLATETGIDLNAVAGWTSNSTFQTVLNPILNAVAVVLRADAIDATATVTPTFTVVARYNVAADSAITLPITLSALASIANDVIITTLQPTLSADGFIVSTQSASVSPEFNVSFTYTLVNGCAKQNYTPFIGAGSASMPDDLPEDSGETGFRLRFPSTGDPDDELVLRSPNLGNTHRLAMTRINRETRGGTLIIFADPIWPKVETLLLTFSALKATEAYAFRDFLRTHLGQEIGIIDWEGRAWTGIVSNPSDPIVEDHKNSFTASVEIEANRV